MNTSRKIMLTVLEEDDDDFFLIEKSLAGTTGDRVELTRAKDGDALLALVRRNGEAPEKLRPRVILLDLNLPKVDGRQVLREIKSDEKLKRIPMIVLTTSSAREDIDLCYALGANAYFVKPSKLSEFQQLMHAIDLHWFQSAEIPAL